MLTAFPHVGRRTLLWLGGALVVLFSAIPLPRFEFLPDSVVDRVIPTIRAASAEEVADLPPAEEPVAQDRVTGSGRDVSTFAAIGVSLDDPDPGPAFVRVHQGGVWGEWRELEFSEDDGPDAASAEAATAAERSKGSVSDPVWVRAADGYEVSVAAEASPGAEVVVVRDTTRFGIAQSTPLAGADVPAPFGIHTRGEWGARATGAASYGDTINLAVVHHSASSNDYSPAEVPAVLRSIQAYHIDGRGWSDIGYNVVVDKYGGVWEGRGGGIDRPVIGAHAGGFNTNAVGVMVIGDYTGATIGPAVAESVSQVIGWKMFLHNSDPAGSVVRTSGGSTSIPAGTVVNLPAVVGHRDVGATGCPGTIEGNLGTIRGRAQAWTNWLRATSVPWGNLDVLNGGVGSVSFSGWAIDPDVTQPARVLVTAGGAANEYLADDPRPDVGAVYPNQGSNRGFAGTLAGVAPGWQQACVTIVNQGYGLGNVGLGCRDVIVADPTGAAPTGSITALGGFAGGFLVGGTVTDPNAGGGSLVVDVEVDGRVVSTVASQAGSGSFATGVFGVLAGRRRVCVSVRNVGPGSTSRVDCRLVDVAAFKPTGVWDQAVVNGAAGAIGIWGWAFDGETTGGITIEVTVDDRRYHFTADQGRPDLAAVLPGYGPNHGFSGTVYPGKGNFRVCVAALDHGGSNHTGLGCKQLVVK